MADVELGARAGMTDIEMVVGINVIRNVACVRRQLQRYNAVCCVFGEHEVPSRRDATNRAGTNARCEIQVVLNMQMQCSKEYRIPSAHKAIQGRLATARS